MKPKRPWTWVAAGFFALAACGVDDRKVDVGDDDDSGAGGEGGNGSGTGGVGTGGGASSGGAGGAGAGGGPGSGGSADAGTGGTGTGGGTGSGGDGAGGTDGGAGGSGAGGAATCTPACQDPTPVCDAGTCVTCLEGQGRCQGSTPQACTSGAWVNGAACAGTTPICAGEGQCTGTRLVGGIVTTAGTTGGTYRLRSGGLEVQPRVCAPSGNVCVTGGIAP